MESYSNVSVSSGIVNCGLELHLWTCIAGTRSQLGNVSGARGIGLCSSQTGLQISEQFIDMKLGTKEGWKTGRQAGLRTD